MTRERHAQDITNEKVNSSLALDWCRECLTCSPVRARPTASGTAGGGCTVGAVTHHARRFVEAAGVEPMAKDHGFGSR
jgi:hypothetical protein